MKTLEYKPYVGLKVFCKKCGYEISGTSEDGRSTDCAHPLESQIYKAVLICPIKGNRRTRNLKAKTFRQAVSELNQFYEELKNPIVTKLLESPKEEKPFGLFNCITMYLDYLNGIGVPSHLRRQRTKMYIYNMELYSGYFLQFLKRKGIDVNTIRIDEINDKIVGEYFEYVISKTKSPSTFNQSFKPIRQMYTFLIEKKDYLIRNPFKKVLLKNESQDPKSITVEEIEMIKAKIKNEDSCIEYKGKERKNRYKYWLKDAIDLALTTGVRREQLANLKWRDITFNKEGEPLYIKSNDLKANRGSNKLGSANEKFVYVPVIPDLKNVLIRLGLKENKHSDKYILAPEITGLRITLCEQMSKGFSFFRDKAGVNKELGFKHLRKTYLTQMEWVLGNAQNVSGHSSVAVLNNHYINKAVIAEKIAESSNKLIFTA